MTKRNAHARQRRYTKLLAMVTAVTQAAWHFGQVVIGSTTRVAGARHVGTSFPHGMCQLSHKRFAPSCGASGPGCKAEVVGSDPFRQPWGITHGPARGQGAYILYGTKLATAAPSFACRRRLEIRGWGGFKVSRGRLRDRLPVSRNILDKRCLAKTKG